MSSPGINGLRHLLAEFWSTDKGLIDKIASALGDGTLEPGTSPLVLRRIVDSNAMLENRLALLLEEWSKAGGQEVIPGTCLALCLSAIAEGARLAKRKVPSVEMVWTGPVVPGSRARSTAEVIRGIIDRTRDHLLVVGYALTAKDLVRRFSEAAERGVRVTMVLHDDPANAKLMRETWPADAPAPRLLTWPAGDQHPMAKLHIKLVASDGQAMLLTSANLTWLGLSENMEMGVMVDGEVVGEFVRHFDALEKAGIIVEIDE